MPNRCALAYPFLFDFRKMIGLVLILCWNLHNILKYLVFAYKKELRNCEKISLLRQPLFILSWLNLA